MLSASIAIVLIMAMAMAVPVLAYVLQERLVFFPQPLGAAERASIAEHYRDVHELVLDADGRRRHAWHIPAARGKPTVIYFGGNAENAAWMIEDARTRVEGVGWLLVDYPGYGGSDGMPSEASITADALLWYDHAVAKLDARRVIAFGRSLGSGVAVFLASQRPIQRVVLVTPYDSMVAVAAYHYPFLPVRLLLRHRFDSIGRAPAIRVPLLCVAAERDEVIPPAHARRLYDAWAGSKQWLELSGAGHNGTDALPAFWPAVSGFLQQ